MKLHHQRGIHNMHSKTILVVTYAYSSTSAKSRLDVQYAHSIMSCGSFALNSFIAEHSPMGLPSAVAKSTAVLVATVAIGAGSVAKLRPDLFMNLPFPLSIILWTATGSGGVPPYFIEEAWAEDEIKTWTRDGDLVVSTGAKSGTSEFTLINYLPPHLSIICHPV